MGYSTSPFDKETNNKNWAIGSHFLASAYLRTMYSREYVIDRVGFNAGFNLIHYSNASFNTPNLGINTLNATIGINYNLNERPKIIEKNMEKLLVKYPVKFNAAFRAVFSESLINGSGFYLFYTLSLFATKKLNYKSRISFGTDIFFSTFMKEYIVYDNIISGTPNETSDWKRVGIFIGHELNMEHFSVITEIGVNAYDPHEYISQVYERFGFRKRFREHFFADLNLKINLFRAEGLEFGIGYQF